MKMKKEHAAHSLKDLLEGIDHVLQLQTKMIANQEEMIRLLQNENEELRDILHEYLITVAGKED